MYQVRGSNQENPQKVAKICKKKSFLNQKPRFILGIFPLDENLMDAFSIAQLSTGYRLVQSKQCVCTFLCGGG